MRAKSSPQLSPCQRPRARMSNVVAHGGPRMASWFTSCEVWRNGIVLQRSCHRVQILRATKDDTQETIALSLTLSRSVGSQTTSLGSPCVRQSILHSSMPWQGTSSNRVVGPGPARPKLSLPATGVPQHRTGARPCDTPPDVALHHVTHLGRHGDGRPTYLAEAPCPPPGPPSACRKYSARR